MPTPDLTAWIQPIVARARVDHAPLAENQAAADAVVAANAAAIDAECSTQYGALVESKLPSAGPEDFAALVAAMRAYAITL